MRKKGVAASEKQVPAPAVASKAGFEKKKKQTKKPLTKFIKWQMFQNLHPDQEPKYPYTLRKGFSRVSCAGIVIDPV